MSGGPSRAPGLPMAGPGQSGHSGPTVQSAQSGPSGQGPDPADKNPDLGVVDEDVRCRPFRCFLVSVALRQFFLTGDE
jgi:hypothetical protein